mmetsp:Transcript_6652/g.14533  ORF Transcript_6652/g.14533 Transcript_6652/m.14533 type:complete len:81 (+) Transcript_6652:647-889(+)
MPCCGAPFSAPFDADPSVTPADSAFRPTICTALCPAVRPANAADVTVVHTPASATSTAASIAVSPFARSTADLSSTKKRH